MRPLNPHERCLVSHLVEAVRTRLELVKDSEAALALKLDLSAEAVLRGAAALLAELEKQP